VETATWRIVPLRTPRVLRRCSRCDAERPFSSTDKFRVNANGRKVDVWLVYRCDACGISWNRTVLERRTPEAIGTDLYRRYEANDLALAWAHAFDPRGVRADADVPLRVEKTGPDVADAIRFEVPYPIARRLDRLLARELGVPRSSLTGVDRRLLRRPVRDGLVLTGLR